MAQQATTSRDPHAVNIRGFSLVELLVVMAIVAILVGTAIPTINRVGGFGTDDQQLGARDLFSILRAARVYSTSHRVETAVVYTVGLREDSVTGATDVRVIDRYATARRLTNAEANAMAEALELDGYTSAQIADMGLGPLYADNPPWVLLQSRNGQFRSLPPAAVLGGVFDNSELATPRSGVQTIFNLYQVVQDDLTDVPTLARVEVPNTPTNDDFVIGEPDSFGAHIFLPSGLMAPIGGGIARYVVEVASAPDASPQERFIDVDLGTTPSNELPGVQLHLYSSTGRVKIASRREDVDG